MLVLAALAAWGVTSLLEGNAAIFAAAALAALVGLVGATLVGRVAPSAVTLFALGYAMRTLCAVVAWYSGKGEAYWVGGIGSDAFAYYETSFLDAGEMLFEMFTFKGFVAYNSFVTHAAESFDQASYLCNLQGPVAGGALLAVMGYATTRAIITERAALTVGVILGLHPTLASISAILLRDSLVGLFGWLFLFLVVRMVKARGAGARVAAVACAGAALYVLSHLRMQSMLVFIGFGLALAWSISLRAGPGGRLTPGVRRALFAIVALGVIGGAGLLLAGRLPQGLSVEHIEYVLQYRAENAAQGSLGASLGSGGLGVATVMYSVLALLAPFPFYAWSAEVLGHPTGPLDYMVGLGGVVNQFLAGFFVIGACVAVRRREPVLLALLACTMGFIALTTLGGGDTIRYVAVHVYAFFLVLAVAGMRATPAGRRAAVGLWLGTMVALYGVYEAMKMAAGPDLLLFGGVSLLLYVAAYGIAAWRIAGRADAVPAADGPRHDAVDAVLIPAD